MITQQAYIDRNLKGFEGDEILARSIKELIDDFAIDTVIETGTFKGGTTKRLSMMAKKVHTIEVSPEYYIEAAAFLKGIKNVKMYLGSSPVILPDIINKVKGRLLMFLDAHWGDHCPLKEELMIVALSGKKPIIVIHDFKVPGRAFGYDSYHGQPYTFEWIATEVNRIYGYGNYTIRYNTRAEGAERGVIFIQPNDYICTTASK